MANGNVPDYNTLVERFREILRYRGNTNTSRSEVMSEIYPVGTRISVQDTGEYGSPWIPGVINGYWDAGPRVVVRGDDILFPLWNQISQIVPRPKNAVKRTPMSRPRNSRNHLGGRRSRRSRRRNTKRRL